MTTVREFDQMLNVSNSSVFDQGYIDWGTGHDDAYIYLVFNNGTHVSRILPEFWDENVVKDIDSWGKVWAHDLKEAPKGPDVSDNVQFVQRENRPKTSFTAYASPDVTTSSGTLSGLQISAGGGWVDPPFKSDTITSTSVSTGDITTTEDEDIIDAEDLDPDFTDDDREDDEDAQGGGPFAEPFTGSVSLVLYFRGREDGEKIRRMLYDASEFIAENADVAGGSLSSTDSWTDK